MGNTSNNNPETTSVYDYGDGQVRWDKSYEDDLYLANSRLPWFTHHRMASGE